MRLRLSTLPVAIGIRRRRNGFNPSARSLSPSDDLYGPGQESRPSPWEAEIRADRRRLSAERASRRSDSGSADLTLLKRVQFAALLSWRETHVDVAVARALREPALPRRSRRRPNRRVEGTPRCRSGAAGP